jgi:hypothetical protein
MTKANIDAAMKECLAFIRSVEEMEREEEKLRNHEKGYSYPSTKHRGTVRRRSMDLTRALAEMRKT